MARGSLCPLATPEDMMTTAKPQPRATSEAKRSRREALEQANDSELLDAVCRGDDVAWETFYDRFRNLTIACITRIGRRDGTRLQPDDLMHILGDVCVNMVAGRFRRLRLYRVDGGCSVSSWIGVIATST